MSACPTCGATYEISVKICPKDGTVLQGSAEAVDTRIGQVLDGKYRLDAALGAGGMGTIYRATHLMLDKPVAVKLIKPELVTSPDLVRRFQREARAAGSLNHPNIAAAYDLGQTPDGTLYIAMELVNGPSLKDVIRSTGPIAFDRAVRIMRQVGSGLALAHRHHIIHRDLKPHNIMLATDGRHEVAKLLDFGIAKTFDEASTQLTQTGFVLGTPQYMSPEQAAGREIDGRSDLYSLGIILYEMLIGEVPFNDPSTPAVLVKHLTEVPAPPSRRRPDVAVSPELEVIALRLLEKDPAARFQSADDLLAALPSDPGTVTAVATESDRTVVLPPRRSVGISSPAGEATVARPSPVAATLPSAPAPAVAQPTIAPAAVAPVHTAVRAEAERAALYVSAPAASSSASTTPHAAAAPSVPLPAPRPAVPPAPPAVEPWVAKASAPSSPREPRPMRDIILLVAILLVVVGGVGYASVRLGLFGGTAEAPGVPAALMGDVPAADSALTSSGASASASAPAPASAPPAAAPGGGAASPAVVGSAAANSGPDAPAALSAPLSSPLSPVPATRPAAVAGRAPAAQVAAPAAPVIPESPAVFFRCTGDAQVCSALRSAMSDSLSRHSLRPITSQSAADVTVVATVTTVDERTEQLFGTTFVTRTYSIEFEGQTTGGDVVPLPPASTLTFDARVGQQRLQDQSRTMSMATASDVRAFWRARLGN